MNTLEGYHEYTGDIQYIGGVIVIHMGVILSTFGDVVQVGFQT